MVFVKSWTFQIGVLLSIVVKAVIIGLILKNLYKILLYLDVNSKKDESAEFPLVRSLSDGSRRVMISLSFVINFRDKTHDLKNR